MKNTIIVAIIIAVISFTAGLYLGDSYGAGNVISEKTSAPERGEYKNTFADGWAAARQKLMETGYMMSEVSSLSGQIKEIKGKEVSFTTNLLNPLDDEALKTRIAVVGNDTKITVYKLKSAEQAERDRQQGQTDMDRLQRENNALQNTLNACGVGPAMMMAEEGESEECKTARERMEKIMADMNEASQKMDMYTRVDNAKISDLAPDWNISVVSVEKKDANEQESAGPAMMMGNYENIGSMQKFNVSSIEAREVSGGIMGM